MELLGDGGDARDLLDDVAPRPLRSRLVVAPFGRGPHHWAGAPSAALAADGSRVLAYRTRNGYDGVDAVVVARSDDGERFESLVELDRARFGARWVERPSVVPTPEGRWRLYVCCAALDGPAWWVVALEADTLEGLAHAAPRTVIPATDSFAVKDPVVRVRNGTWEAWLCCHLLDVPGEEDRMRAHYATSPDGWTWTDHGPVLVGSPGSWDARGVRVTGMLPDGRAFYDGRASAEENWFERSSLAAPTGPGPAYAALPEAPVVDVRYVEPLIEPDGGLRLYYEARRPDGSHELRTERRGLTRRPRGR